MCVRGGELPTFAFIKMSPSSICCQAVRDGDHDTSSHPFGRFGSFNKHSFSCILQSVVTSIHATTDGIASILKRKPHAIAFAAKLTCLRVVPPMNFSMTTEFA